VTGEHRDQLILDHMPLVARIAGKIKRKLPPCYDLCDLISMGTIGLIQALPSLTSGLFPAQASPPKSRSARLRIKGAILDNCRKRKWEEETRPEVNLWNVRATGVSAESLSDQASAVRLIQRATNLLPEREALVIELHYRGDISIKAIASMRKSQSCAVARLAARPERA
jgi:RNA polymerase sigma factor (sigma-70 family)